MNDRETLGRLFAYSRPYRGRLLWAMAGMVIYAVGSAGLPVIIKLIIDNALIDNVGVALVAWGIIVVFFLKGVGSYVSSYLMADVGQRVVTDLRDSLYDRILKQSAKFFADRDTGDLLSRINNDVGRVQQVVSDTVGDLARETLSLVGYLGVLFYTDARLAISSLVVAPIIVYPLIRLGQRVRRTTLRSQEAISRLTHLAKEAFDGHRIVKAFGTEELEANKFKAAAYHLFRTNMK
ncbi:MAG TPA: ABC transporter transmembrane domain-containing protein, partial [Vicinamibacterales bacterium]|nr:ABC transporter transmembrane domain-containing protein [Vicinamibacterales bacterium]